MKKNLLICCLIFYLFPAMGQYNIQLNIDQLQKLEADAGKGDTLCGLSAPLVANSVTENGFWEQVSGPGNTEFAPDESAPSTQIKVSEDGIYGYAWTEDDGICTRTDTIYVGFYQPPHANAGSGDTLCGKTYNLNASLTSGLGRWSLLSGPGDIVFSPDSTSADAEIDATKYGHYKLIWTEINGICVDHDSLDLVFNEFPKADAGSDEVIENGEEVEIGGNPTANGGSEVYSYSWSPENGLNNPNVANPMASPSDTTNYILVVEDENGCSDRDTVTVYVKTTTSIGDLSSKAVKIYPNPARDILNIVFAEKVGSDYMIKISNAQGITMVNKEIIDNQKTNHSIDLSGLASGIYFIQIYNGQHTQTWKIMIEK